MSLNFHLLGETILNLPQFSKLNLYRDFVPDNDENSNIILFRKPGHHIPYPQHSRDLPTFRTSTRIHEAAKNCVNKILSQYLFVNEAYDGLETFELIDNETGEFYEKTRDSRIIVPQKNRSPEIRLPKQQPITLVKGKILGTEFKFGGGKQIRSSIEIKFNYEINSTPISTLGYFFPNKYNNGKKLSLISKSDKLSDLVDKEVLILLYERKSVYSDPEKKTLVPLCFSNINKNWETLESYLE